MRSARHRTDVGIGDPSSGASLDELESVYRGEFARFLRVATAIIGDDQLAEDAIDDAFVGLVRYRSGFRRKSAVEAWAWAAVIRSARQMAARRAQAPIDDSVASSGMSGPQSESGVDHETIEQVRASLAALPERQRLALFLRHYADLDYQAIAAIMGISLGAVSATIHKAHANLEGQTLEAVK